MSRTDSRIWKEIRGDEDIFEGLGDQSFRTASSATAPSPFIRLDPFHTESFNNVANEAAVEDPDIEDEEEGWSDVSV